MTGTSLWNSSRQSSRSSGSSTSRTSRNNPQTSLNRWSEIPQCLISKGSLWTGPHWPDLSVESIPHRDGRIRSSNRVLVQRSTCTGQRTNAYAFIAAVGSGSAQSRSFQMSVCSFTGATAQERAEATCTGSRSGGFRSFGATFTMEAWWLRAVAWLTSHSFVRYAAAIHHHNARARNLRISTNGIGAGHASGG